MSAALPVYVCEGLLPNDGLCTYVDDDTNSAPTAAFTSASHLANEAPSTVVTMNFETMSLDDALDTQQSVAYTLPFKVLSADGVRIINDQIHRHAHLARRNERNHALRGLCYRARWIRDFVFAPEIVSMCSAFAGKTLWPHQCFMNDPHINFGFPNDGREVDAWHFDSTDYVLVVLASDPVGMRGGELRVCHLPRQQASALPEVPSKAVHALQFPEAGYGIFLRGSEVMHSVAPILASQGPRISVVLSFSAMDVFEKDRTCLCTFRNQAGDPADVANYEFARHRAWRCAGKMKYLIDQCSPDMTADSMAEILNLAGEELLQTARVLQGLEDDSPGFIREKRADGSEGVEEQGR